MVVEWSLPEFPLVLVILVDNCPVKFSEYVKNCELGAILQVCSTYAEVLIGWSGVLLSRLVPLTSLLAGTAPGDMDTCRIPLLVFVFADRICADHWQWGRTTTCELFGTSLRYRKVWPNSLFHWKSPFQFLTIWSTKYHWKPRRSALQVLYPLRWRKFSRKNSVL